MPTIEQVNSQGPWRNAKRGPMQLGPLREVRATHQPDVQPSTVAKRELVLRLNEHTGTYDVLERTRQGNLASCAVEASADTIDSSKRKQYPKVSEIGAYKTPVIEQWMLPVDKPLTHCEPLVNKLES